MRYDDEDLQDRLASEYVLGNLHGAARRRLVALMAQRADLRARVEHWEELMYPFTVRAPRVKAPDQVWQKIHARISRRAERAGARRLWWAGFATAALSCALLAALVVGLLPPHAAPSTMVAVLHNAQAQPALLFTWTPRQATGRQIAVKVLAHPEMPAGTSWEAWLLIESGDVAPISLGLVTTEVSQLLTLSEAAARALPRASMIAVTVEPKGGSRSGQPSLPFQFIAPALRVDG